MRKLCVALAIALLLGAPACALAGRMYTSEPFRFEEAEVPLSDGLADADFAYVEANGEVRISGYLGSATQVAIPPTINGCPVTGIDDDAFEDVELVMILGEPGSAAEVFATEHGIPFTARSEG